MSKSELLIETIVEGLRASARFADGRATEAGVPRDVQLFYVGQAAAYAEAARSIEIWSIVAGNEKRNEGAK